MAASASDAFDVVIPSMPGYGFSGKPTTTGWDPVRIARAWIVLMKRLGYTRFVAQGGDWGAIVIDRWPCRRRRNCSAFTPTCRRRSSRRCEGAPVRRPAAIRSLRRGKTRVRAAEVSLLQDVAYALEMGTRPQTLYGMADSPVGLAAWMLDHDARSYAAHRARCSRRTARWRSHARRHPRQHHALLADEHGDFFGSSLLGKQVAVFRPEGRLHPGRRERLSGRDLCSSAELGGAGVSQTHPLQQARQRRALCGLGTAEAPGGRAARGFKSLR